MGSEESGNAAVEKTAVRRRPLRAGRVARERRADKSTELNDAVPEELTIVSDRRARSYLVVRGSKWGRQYLSH